MHFGNVSLLDLFNSYSLLDSINNSDKNLNSNETELLSSKNTFSELMFNISDLNKKVDGSFYSYTENMKDSSLNNELGVDSDDITQIKSNAIKGDSNLSFIELKSYQSNISDLGVSNFNNSEINLNYEIDNSNLELKTSENINSIEQFLDTHEDTYNDGINLELVVSDKSHNLIFNTFIFKNNNSVKNYNNLKNYALINDNIVNKTIVSSDINIKDDLINLSNSNEDTLLSDVYLKDLNENLSDTNSIDINDFKSNSNDFNNNFKSNLNETNETINNQDDNFSNSQNYEDNIFNQVKSGLNELSGSKHIKLQLKPHGLGNVGVNMKFINGKLELTFTVDTSIVEDVLMSNISQLESILSSSGVVSINDIKIKKRNDEKSSILFKNRYLKTKESKLSDLKINMM